MLEKSFPMSLQSILCLLSIQFIYSFAKLLNHQPSNLIFSSCWYHLSSSVQFSSFLPWSWYKSCVSMYMAVYRNTIQTVLIRFFVQTSFSAKRIWSTARHKYLMNAAGLKFAYSPFKKSCWMLKQYNFVSYVFPECASQDSTIKH